MAHETCEKGEVKMKISKITFIAMAILATILIGAIAFNVLAPAQEFKLKVKWRPVSYTLGNPLPDPWYAEIFFAPLRDLNQIDTSTLLLEGMYTPSGTPTILNSSPPRMSIPFNGNDVIRVALSKMGHMAPGYTYHISLRISGYLKAEYGGNPFSGDGAINLVIPELPPP
jgi:hypothetical protein